ncbi:MAG: FAD-dependent oxidoreductase [Actinomycetes bacterium]
MTITAPVGDALRDAEPRAYWTDRADAPEPCDPVSRTTTCDLLVIGGGFTGLWAAIEARALHPSAEIVLVETREIAFGASGRNGGFISESLTHGLAHGLGCWPDEMDMLVRLGRENLAEIAAFVAAEGIAADLSLCGKTAVATKPHHLSALAQTRDLSQSYGEDVTLLDAAQMRADVDSPTYLGGLRTRTGGGLVDPAALCWGLKAAALRRGIRIHEGTEVLAMRTHDDVVQAATPRGRIEARGVILATNAYAPLLKSLRNFVLPIYDHVLVTEPLTEDSLARIGWSQNQGLTDVGNQFHYYRRTAGDRILWGGYDAIYYYGNKTDAAREQRDQSHQLLAQQFFQTFPQLEGLRFTHRWAGLIDSTSRFTPVFGTALSGRVAYAVGFTGLGVAASRFGARVALDLLGGQTTERTRLEMVRRKPVPFPPEPLRYPVVQATRAALAREDGTGRRGSYLRLLDKLGVGFNS